MNCPHCGRPVTSSQQQYQQRQIARGNCPKCGKPHEGKFVLCFACRLRMNAQRRVRWRQLHPRGGLR